jgi:hypothetical protein
MASALELGRASVGEDAPSAPRTGDVDRPWLREAASLPFVQKVRVSLAALWLFVRAPREFGAAWSLGDAAIPNPLVAMAASLSILAVFGQEMRRIMKGDSAPHTLLASIAETLGPYTLYVGTALVAHVVLVVLGSRRKVSTTIGVTLLAAAGPGTLLAFGVGLPALALFARYGVVNALNPSVPIVVRLAVVAVVVGLYLYFVVLLQLALAGAHGVATWKAIVAGAVGVLAIAIVCGTAERAGWWPWLTGSLGPHLTAVPHARGLSLDFMY